MEKFSEQIAENLNEMEIMEAINVMEIFNFKGDL